MLASLKLLPRQAAAICLILCVAIVVMFYHLYKNIRDEHILFQKLLDMGALGYEMEMTSDFLTREVRKFAVSGDSKHFDAFWKEVYRHKTRDKAVTTLRTLNIDEKALQNFVMAKKHSDILIETEDSAMRAAAAGDLRTAKTLVFGLEYAKQKEIIRGHLLEYRQNLEHQIESAFKAKRKLTDILVIATGALLFLCLVFVIVMLYMVAIVKRVNAQLETAQNYIVTSKNSEAEIEAELEESEIYSKEPEANSEEPEANSEEPEANSEEPEANSENNLDITKKSHKGDV